MADWIFTGDQNIRGEQTSADSAGELIRPFTPFACSANWRGTQRRNPVVDRRLMTVQDYERSLRPRTLHQLLAESQRVSKLLKAFSVERAREITTNPIDVVHAKWMLEARTVVDAVRDAVVVRHVEGEEEPRLSVAEQTPGARFVADYDLDLSEVTRGPAEEASGYVRAAIVRYLEGRTGHTEDELRSLMVDNLMRPLFRLQGVPSQEEAEAASKEAERQSRREKVSLLARGGLAQQKIAELLGISRSTVQADLKAVEAAG